MLPIVKMDDLSFSHLVAMYCFPSVHQQKPIRLILKQEWY